MWWSNKKPRFLTDLEKLKLLCSKHVESGSAMLEYLDLVNKASVLLNFHLRKFACTHEIRPVPMWILKYSKYETGWI